MKIYKVSFDSEHYQQFLPDDQAIWNTDQLRFECKKKAAHWNPPKVYVDNPVLQKGNFYGLAPGTIVVDSYAIEKLHTLLRMAGELLPLHHGGEEYSILNVTECVNALDEDRTEWTMGRRTGAKLMIAAYAFKKDRLHQSSIFKLPERLVDLLVWERCNDPESEFKAAVEQFGLTGLKFDEVWDEERETLIRRSLFGVPLQPGKRA